MVLKTIVAVSAGASLGALLRLALSESLNATFPAIPPGTLLSNLIGPAARMAAVRHHWFLRRPHDVLDVLRGVGDSVAAGSRRLGRRGRGHPPFRLGRDDIRGHRHGLFRQKINELADFMAMRTILM